MENKNNVVTVTLSIKETSRENAENELVYRLNQWFQETSIKDLIQGEGYPVKSLIHYSIHENK